MCSASRPAATCCTHGKKKKHFPKYYHILLSLKDPGCRRGEAFASYSCEQRTSPFIQEGRRTRPWTRSPGRTGSPAAASLPNLGCSGPGCGCSPNPEAVWAPGQAQHHVVLVQAVPQGPKTRSMVRQENQTSQAMQSRGQSCRALVLAGCNNNISITCRQAQVSTE